MFGRQRKKQGQQCHQYEDANKYIFKCRLKVDSDDDDVTNDGKLFHARALSYVKNVSTDNKYLRPVVLVIYLLAYFLLSAQFTALIYRYIS